jgi:hypothetical protein
MKKIVILCIICILNNKLNYCFSQDNDTSIALKSWNHTAKDVLKTSVLSVPLDFKIMWDEVTKKWKKTAIITAGITALVFVDNYTTKFYQDEIETRIKYSLPNITLNIPFGNGKNLWPLNKNDSYIGYSILGLYAGSLIANYKTGQRASINSIKSLAYSVLISQMILKPLIGRQRPNPKLSNNKIPKFPFSNNHLNFGNLHWPNINPNPYGTGMPSFHSTAYFTVAQVMAMEFNNYWIPYSVVGLIFLSDIKSHRHWISDMIAGGFVGGLIGTAVVKGSRLYEAKKKNKINGTDNSNIDFKVIPNLSRNFTGLHLIGTF